MLLSQTIKYIPRAFITKEIGMSTATRILEIPMRVSPSSSGSGDAMMNAPNIGDNHFIKPR